mgnify:FL=1
MALLTCCYAIPLGCDDGRTEEPQKEKASDDGIVAFREFLHCLLSHQMAHKPEHSVYL